ncbi:hypothetical protein niasHT_025497 [Heterodera trifolii]|uniref:Uncharacterized protein n=1 Tax=Heterodera trifolii TaxID=157864 RepID=A0ABD2J8N6_9BILA
MEWFGSEFFSKSWGPPELLKKLQHYQYKYPRQGALMEIIERRMPTMVIEKEWVKDGVQFVEGWFRTPLATLMPEIFNNNGNGSTADNGTAADAGNCNGNLARATWRAVLPTPGTARRALVVNLAPTGDQGYWRRENFFQAAQMCRQQGVSSIMLTNPYYGERRPKAQSFSRLFNVSDLFVMGGCLMLECCFLLLWARQQGFYPLGLTGVSMGGHMASLASTNFITARASNESIALVPCLSWTSAAPVFTQGLLARAVRWDALSAELDKSVALRRVLDECGWAAMMDDANHVTAKLFPDSRARRLMWILMDEFTNLCHYPTPPTGAGAMRFVVAEHDEYVPHNAAHVPHAQALWNGDAQVHVVPGVGHVWAYFKHHAVFRQHIVNSLATICPSAVTVEPLLTSSSSSSTSTPAPLLTNLDLNWKLLRRFANNMWVLRSDDDVKSGGGENSSSQSASANAEDGGAASATTTTTTTATTASAPSEQQQQ